MATRYKVKCMVCTKNASFEDAKDVIQSRWRILGWDVGTADPKVVCPDCEYLPTEAPKKKKK